MKKERYKPLFLPALRGSAGVFLLGAIEVVLGIVALYASSLVTSYTLDYVLLNQDPSIPAFLFNWLKSLGPLGRSYWMCGLCFILFTALNGLFTFLRRRNVAKGSERMAKKMRDTLYRKLNAVPYDYHKHISTGDLVQRCTSDVDRVRIFVSEQLIFDAVLENRALPAQKNIVLANAAFGIQVLEKGQKTIEECIDIARESIDSGAALRTFRKFVELNS